MYDTREIVKYIAGARYRINYSPGRCVSCKKDTCGGIENYYWGVYLCKKCFQKIERDAENTYELFYFKHKK